jgi:hypothetical protein
MAKKSNAGAKLIANMGLFWREDYVYWGEPGRGNPGGLMGVRSTARTSEHVDFRDQKGIYVLYSDYNIVYIGQAGSGEDSLYDRINKHRSNERAGRWDRFSWFGLCRVLKGENKLAPPAENVGLKRTTILNHIEGVLIHVAEPPLNRQGGKLPGVDNYLQVRDDRLPPTIAQLHEETHKQIARLEEQIKGVDSSDD